MAGRLLKYTVALFVLCACLTTAYLTLTHALQSGPEQSEPEIIPIFEEAKVKSETNGVGAKLVLIPAGKYKMGNGVAMDDEASFVAKHFPPGASLLKFEYPAHEVQITKPFWMGAHHVTLAQFKEFVADTGYVTDAEKEPGAGVCGVDIENGEYATYRPHSSWRNLGFPQTGNHPVVGVSWNDAKAYCAWLSHREKATYRLPTEAEWEYACRAGTTTRFWCGNSFETLPRVANTADDEFRKFFPKFTLGRTGNDGFPFTSPVGSFAPNPFGLFDMGGNASQWCEDGWRIYGDNPVTDPVGDSERPGYRGGSWKVTAINCRCAARMMPSSRSVRDDGLGFRVVRNYGEGQR